MSNSVVVKQVTIDELEHVAALFNEYRVFYKQDPDLEGAKAFLLERFIHRDSVIFAAYDNERDQYIGFTQLYPTFSSISMQRSWILNDLYVKQDYRGQGVGKLLLAQAKTYAKQTRSKGLGLSTAVDNVTAQHLYETQGFVKDADFYHYYLKV